MFAAVLVEAIKDDGLKGQGLTITGSEALRYADRAGVLTRALGKPVRYDDISAPDFTAALLGAGSPTQYAEYMTVLYDQVVRKGFVSTVTDNVKKVTGKDPIKLAQYAKDYASAFEA